MPDFRFLKKLQPLVSKWSIPGWILTLPTVGRWLYKAVDVSSNLDWLWTVFRSDLMSKLWVMLISPTGSFVMMLLGLGWLGFVAVRTKPKELEPANESPELNSADSAVTTVVTCRDTWLHDLADREVNKVWEFIELLKVGVWPLDMDAHIPTIKWGFVLKNNSLFPISLDGNVRGHLTFEGTKLLEQRTLLINEVDNLQHLGEGRVTFEQRLSPLEANVIRNTPKGKFSFQGVQIYIKGAEGFEQIKSRQVLAPDNFKVCFDQYIDKTSLAVTEAVEEIEAERDALKEKNKEAVAPPGNLVINSARYGVPGIYEEDVKGLLSAMIVNNTLSLKEYYNDFLPDKVKTKRKRLYIEYFHNGIAFSVDVPENARITLPIAYQDPKQLLPPRSQ